MALPDRVAAELLAHEHLQQHVADGLDGRVGKQELDVAATVLHVDAQTHQDGSIRRSRDRGKARIGLQTIDVEADR